MSSVSLGDVGFAAKLVHELQVRRRSGTLDRFGQEVDENPTALADFAPDATYRCRLDPGKGGLVNQERSIDVFEVRHMIYTEPEADVLETDAIRVVDPKTGEELMPPAKVKQKNKVYDIDGPHHLEIEASVQRGPW